jgi:hypothetical protein
MDCAKQPFFGLIGSHDPAIISEASCSASVVRNRHVSCYRYKRGQIENHDQECLGIGRSDQGGISFSSRRHPKIFVSLVEWADKIITE